jgi:hypothetical protein
MPGAIATQGHVYLSKLILLCHEMFDVEDSRGKPKHLESWAATPGAKRRE